ncbi:MAG: protein translocase subunit SecF [Gammaproteobacteria bacterium]
MEMFKKTYHVDFLKIRYIVGATSILLVLLTVWSLATRGLNFGIDFTGGTLLEVSYPEAVVLEDIRTTLAEGGFPQAEAQHFGTSTDVLIRLAPEPGKESAQLSETAMQALRVQNPAVEMRRVEFVGPQVGKELAEQGGLAMLYALIGIFIYIIVRFQWRFAPGAIIATAHDVVIILGIFSFLQYEFDLTVLAAILAVIGYSLNDTIVVYDRIRENFRRIRKASSYDIINTAINQTMSRTIMTGLTTLLVLVALYYFGGETIHNFSLALILGILVGTYSSVYVASAIALALGVSKADLIVSKPQEEGSTGAEP